MVELGDTILTMDDREVKKHVPIDAGMLDYSYVSRCDDLSLLKEILRVLKSGKEGYYPPLEKKVEEKIIALLPERQRQKLKALSSTVPTDIIEAEKEAVGNWIDSLSMLHHETNDSRIELPQSNEVTARDKITSNYVYPPIRGTISEASSTPTKVIPCSKRKQENLLSTIKDKEFRISKEKLSNKDYFKAWDKFLMKIS